MKNEQEKTEWMQNPVVVWLGAMLCCFLWGSAFLCGYAFFACGHTGNRARKYA